MLAALNMDGDEGEDDEEEERGGSQSEGSAPPPTADSHADGGPKH